MIIKYAIRRKSDGMYFHYNQYDSPFQWTSDVNDALFLSTEEDSITICNIFRDCEIVRITFKIESTNILKS